jgi:hypothetical protein
LFPSIPGILRLKIATLLFTDSGTSGFFYEIVIGGNGNSVAILRRRIPGILGNKQYVSVGLYQTRISALFLEIASDPALTSNFKVWSSDGVMQNSESATCWYDPGVST